MKTPLKKLSPSQAWGDVQRKAMAIGVATWVVLGILQAAGAIPAIARPSLAPAAGSVSAFLAAHGLLLAHYHRRWSLGLLGAALALLLPYSVSFLWVRFSGLSLIYPLFSLALIGVIILAVAHHRISGPHPDDDVREAMARRIWEEIGPLSWVDRVMWLCITVGVLLSLALLLWRAYREGSGS